MDREANWNSNLDGNRNQNNGNAEGILNNSTSMFKIRKLTLRSFQ